MSRPNIAGPTSARGLVFAVAGFFFAISISLLILFLGCGRAAEGNKKPTAVSSRGFLSKHRSTSANGVANYDDDQNDSL
jgi:hypothetical protein